MKTIEDAIGELRKNYEEALKISYIDRPVTFALYVTLTNFIENPHDEEKEMQDGRVQTSD